MMGPGMNIETGVFTAGYGGVYQISWSINAVDHTAIDDMTVYLYKNSMQIPETILKTIITGYTVRETSGRSIYLRLDEFDQLYLHCEPCPAISYINFCVSLAHLDSK